MNCFTTATTVPPHVIRASSKPRLWRLSLGKASGLDVTDAARDYIHLYRGDSAALSESLGRIQRTSAAILMRIGLGADALEDARSAA
jgi:hypothetical protein